MRMTTAEVELGGVTLPKGAVVFVILGAANRDEAVFADPDRFDMDRGSQGGLAFGHGIHFCIGAMVSRLEARAGIRALASRSRGFDRIGGALRYQDTVLTRSVMALPLRFSPA